MRWTRLDGKSDPFIVAEIGASHEGDFGRMLGLIESASAAGCDAVKIQLYDSERLARQRHAEAYIENYRRFEIPKAWLKDIYARASFHEIQLVISVYDEQNFDDAEGFADMIKIASFEAMHDPLREAVSRGTTKPVIVSTGMTNHQDVIKLQTWRQFSSQPRALLHCISAYPTPIEKLQLRQIKNYELDGFSDHTGVVDAGGLAVACGAKIIEVHIRFSDTSPLNPDYKHSMPLTRLHDYTKFCRRAAAAIAGPPMRYIEGIEIPMTAYRTGMPS